MAVYRGNFLYTPALGQLKVVERGWLITENGLVRSLTQRQPASAGPLTADFGDALILPAFTDLHLHAPQLPNMGLGYSEGLGGWLERYTYPVEHRYADPGYAHQLNAALISQLRRYGSLHAVIMGSTSAAAATDLLEQYRRSGMWAYVGKMNSDYPGYGVQNEQTAPSIAETVQLAHRYGGPGRVRYAISPEFVPCCSDELMTALGQLARETGLPVHSHMSEGESDLQLVRRRFPREGCYAGVYARFGLMGSGPSVMAHCLTSPEEEIALLKQHGSFVAHCPVCSLDLAGSGLPPIRRYLNEGIPVGLGSDIAGGHTLNMMQVIVAAVQISKLVVQQKPQLSPLSEVEALYLATKGGGAFFGRVGSFEPGYSFDALVIDDRDLGQLSPLHLSPAQRLERFLYCGDDRHISRRYCAGRELTAL